MSVPLYGFRQGDTIGLLVVAEETDSIQILADKLQEAASIRVAPARKVHLIYKEKVLDPTLTIAQAGLQALDRFDVVPV
jgi:toluene-4-monooxygenase system protein B